MDVFTLVVGVAATVVIGALMMVIAKFGFGGESEYEQQIAHQKEVLLVEDKGKNADKKKAKTEKKKKAKSKSDATGHASGSELENDNARESTERSVPLFEELPPHIEYDPDPVIIEPDQPAPAKPSKKTKKSAPGKSILHNRDEVPMVRSGTAAVAETVFSETAPPKDDLELKHVKAKKAGHKKEKQKPIVTPAEEVLPVVDDVVVPTAVKSQSAAPEPQEVAEEMVVAKTEAPVSSGPPQHAKKSKGKGKAVSDLEDIIKIVGEAPLSKDQMQTLVECILARMESEDSWTTRGAKPEPVVLLRKQLEETQSALAEEQNNVLSAHAKVKEVTNKWTAAEKLNSNSAAQLLELQKRMQHTHDQHTRQIQTMTDAGYQDKQKVEQQKEIIGQLSEENQRLKQSVANTDEVAQMQNQLRALIADKQTLTKKASDTDKLAENTKHEIARANENCKTIESEKQELKKRCDDLGQKLAQSENAVAQAQSKATEAERNVKNLQDHVQSQIGDKDRQIEVLKDDLSKTRDLQLHSSTNGDHVDGPANGVSGDNSDLGQRISNLEQMVSDKDSQVSSLNKQLQVAKASQNDLNALKQKSSEEANKQHELESQVTNLLAQVQTLKDKNNELKRKIWALNDSLEKAESLSLSSTATERDIEDKICTINELKDRNSKLLSQNNELQEKCDNVSSLNTEVSSLMKQVNESKVTIDQKDQLIGQLEHSLKEEEDKASAIESECRDILEKDFSLKVEGMAEEHEAYIKRLRTELDAHQQKLGVLESSCNDQQAIINSLKGNSSTAQQEVDKLTGQLEILLQEKQQLEGRVVELEPESSSTVAPVSNSSDNNLLQYKNALSQVDTMLDSLAVNVEKEHGKLAGLLQSKDEQLTSVQGRLDDTAKQLVTSNSKQGEAAELTRQLKESNQRLAELETKLQQADSAAKTELSRVENALKDEQLKSRQLAQHLAAAIAAGGDGEDTGTCV